MKMEFTGKLWLYRGPAPWSFVTVPPKESRLLKEMSKALSSRWGSIPVQVRVGQSAWKTSLFPKDDHYDLPIKASVREAEGLKEGHKVTVRIEVR